MVGMMLDMTGDPDDLRKKYEAVNDDIGRSDKFEGLIMHTAGPTDHGWRVVDVWESQAKLEAFSNRLSPIIDKHGLPRTMPQFWTIENTQAGKPLK